jgi:RNA 2',3'-cyclic 3'-phosphodiesterase
MSETTHHFLAIRLPEATKKELHDAREHFEKVFSFNRWVHMEDYHITLAFLGFATQNQLMDVKELVMKEIQGIKPISLRISHIGTFGMKTAPRIFWAGVNDSKELHQLREQVYTACGMAGFLLEKRPFHPHITIARKWSSDVAFEPSALEHGNIFEDQMLEFLAEDVVLYRTNLTQTPKYENLISFSLRS